MNLTLHLTPEIEAKLLEQASVLGKEPEQIVLEAVQEKFTAEKEEPQPLARDAWLAEFRAFTASSPDGNVNADVSRESIYEGRGE